MSARACDGLPGGHRRVIKSADWNQAHLIAHGNMLTEILNGHVTSIWLKTIPK